MSTFRDDLAADVTDVFLPTDADGNSEEFNETVTFYPRWDTSRKQTLQALVTEDSLEGTREARGDGVVRNDRDGRRTRESAIFSVPQTIEIQETQSNQFPDAFEDESGTLWKVQTVLGRDSLTGILGLQDLLCVRVHDRTIRNESRSG